ncbi:hypothetical protein PISL3812_01936 [Talaromyces islandicus]|uniref:Multidrug resistance-associated protein 1 n=1 Tax=Talaromyces islandicus TaxID=28573 RepID=A0A0U1LNS9_TALIS|nr:hypothetical protein PISL3812_01936 [Talaromyces islandicus]
MENVTLCGDNNFGPQVNDCRGDFDFTLLFEECFLSIVPSVLLLLALPARYRLLCKKRTKEVAKTPIYWAKLLLALGFGLSQLSLVVIWALPHSPRTQASLAAAVVALIAYGGLQLLSHLEHLYSIQPSLLLNLFLSLSLLFDIARVRTLWLAHYTAIATVYTISISLKLVWFYLESRTKQAHFINRTIQYGSEEIRGLYSRSFFWWINQLFILGFKKNLSVESLPQLDQALSSNTVHHAVQKLWGSAPKSSRNTLAWCIFHAFKSSVLYSFMARLALIGLNYSQPFLISRLTNYVGDKSPDKNVGYGLIGGFALVFILKAVFTGLSQHHNFRFITQIRGAIVSMIYEKTLEVRSNTDNDLPALTLMSNEVENISIGIQNAHETWASLIELGIAVYLLEIEVLWAAGIPAAISLAVFYVTGLISKTFPKRQAAWMQAVRQRVAFTSNYLNMIKAVKMLGLSEQVSAIAQGLRFHELNLQKKFRHSMVMMNLVAGISANLSPVITLSVYTGIAFCTGRNPLTVAQSFMTLSIILLAASPLSNLVYSVPRAVGAIECFQRIQEYLLETPRHDYRRSLESHQSFHDASEKMSNSGGLVLSQMGNTIIQQDRPSQTTDAVVIHEAYFSWNVTKSILSKISIKLPHGSFTMIIGPVGSGKSMLLQAILGELHCIKGYVQIQLSLTVSFCATNPWIRHKTIRETILGPLEYDEKWYQTVIKACALEEDIKALPQGHSTLLGSNGISISGGQRQRIAIARAVYARAQLALFDDVLSALDAKTYEHVFTHVFGVQGLLRQNGVTIVLVAHAHDLTAADQIVVLKEGKILEHGHPQELVANKQSLSARDVSSQIDLNTIFNSTVNHQSMNLPESQAVKDMADQKLGDLTNYTYYVEAAGAKDMLVYFLCLFIGAFCTQFPNLWIQWWAEDNTRLPFRQLAKYISVYFILAIMGSALWAFCMWLIFCRIVPKSSSRFHEYLVTKIKDAPLFFLTSTDTGIILNRFSQDMTLVDRSLPADFLKTTNNFVQCLMSAFFISVGAKYLTPLMPIVGFAVYLIQKFYLRTSRQLRQLDLETKSPLYTQFTETTIGLTTIRAFGWQQYLHDEHQKLLQASQRPFFTLFVIQRWLILVLDLLVAGIAIMLCLLAVFVPNIGPIGVSLISLVTFSQQLGELVNFWTSMETSIGAITRIRGFQKDVPNENLPSEDQIPSSVWPPEGQVVLHDVSAGYSLTAQPVLRDISFTVTPGTGLGICGRTGSGKSSLILAILRMVEIQKGNLTIDGVDLQTCPRHIVRSKVTVIPQDPLLLSDRSVRDNLTGFITDSTENDDLRILNALEKVQLREYVESFAGALDAKIGDLFLSTGQQQLICLARAIIMKRKILLLDEATSNVDHKTDELMQRVIRAEFSDCTIIAVAHRLNDLIDFDMVAVMDEGRIAEKSKRNGRIERRLSGKPSDLEKIGQHHQQKQRELTHLLAPLSDDLQDFRDGLDSLQGNFRGFQKKLENGLQAGDDGEDVIEADIVGG